MKKTLIGAAVILALIMVVSLAIYFLLSFIQDKDQKDTSDAVNTKGKVTLALDNWIGYFPFRSPLFKKRLRQKGWTIAVEDDQADYGTRMKRLNDGEIEFAVVTVDSYILNAEKYNFPGTIVLVIDESQGGDCILARKEKFTSLDEIKGKQNIRVAFTPDSPSHHLLKAASEHFNVSEILPPAGPRRIETMGSSEARKKLQSGKADIGVCWEPDVSKALEKDSIVKLLGTEDTKQLIVDILVVNRKWAKENPEGVNVVLATYFRVLKAYKDDEKLFIKDIKSETKQKPDAIRKMLKGVRWPSLSENGSVWFGIGSSGDAIADTIESAARILVSAGDFKSNPIPDGDPYRLINSTFLSTVQQQTSGFTTPQKGVVPANSLETEFSSISKTEWDALKQVGTLKVEPIIFQSGSEALDLISKEVIDQVAKRMRHYPHFRIKVNGHTGTMGDPEQNKILSQKRAEAVARYLTVTYDVDPDRLFSVGYGGTEPLPKKTGQSERAWEYSLPRVGIVLVREDL